MMVLEGFAGLAFVVFPTLGYLGGKWGRVKGSGQSGFGD